MSRSVRWSVTVVVAAVVFGVCLWAGRSAPFGWMPEGEAERWAVATAFATVMTTVAAAAVGWWAGREQPAPLSAERTVSQQATASGRGRVEQVGGTRNAPSPGGGGVPGRVEQGAEVSDGASVTQVGGGQYTGSGDDEQRRRS